MRLGGLPRDYLCGSDNDRSSNAIGCPDPGNDQLIVVTNLHARQGHGLFLMPLLVHLADCPPG